MKPRILLANLATSSAYRKEFKKSHSMPPLGLLYIATHLQRLGFPVEVIDFSVESFTRTQITERLLSAKPDIIGLSTYMESWSSQKALTALIRKVLPDTLIVAGGAFATFCHEDMLKNSNIDVVIRGEGEIAMSLLADTLRNQGKTITFDQIPGAVYLNETGELSFGPANERIKDLDALAFPDRDLVDREKYSMPFTLSTTRGCPGDCIFCSSRGFWGKAVRMRSAKNIYDEIIEYYQKYKDTFFYVADDTLTTSRSRVFELCTLLKSSGIKFAWGCESRADVVDTELIECMFNAGCKKIQFGFESADDEILKKLGKKVTVREIEKAVAIAHSYGMHVSVSFIVGHAFDTDETIKKTIDFASHLRTKYGAYLMGSVNTPFPGTRQYDEAESLGITIHSKNWDEYRLNNVNISTKHLPQEALQRHYNSVLGMLMQN